MLGETENLPREIICLLDAEKVGAKMREQDQGFFTSKGYLYRNAREEQEVYDGIHLPK